MKKVENFDGAKKGEWYIFLPIDKKDKREDLIKIKKNESEIFSFNGEEFLHLKRWVDEDLENLIGLFSRLFILFKLNKEEIKQYKKLVLVSSL